MKTESIKKRFEEVEDNVDKVLLENRELDQRVEKLEGGKKIMEKKEREEFTNKLKDLLKNYGFKNEGISNVRIHLKPDFLVTVDTE